MTEIVDLVEELKKRRQEVWFIIPTEIRTLLDRKRPAGPVIYAEGETRTLHELLFACYDAGVRNEVSLSCVKKFTRILLQFYGGKLKNWYGLVDIATLLEKIESNLDNVEQMEDFLNLIKELLLFVGRINMWLDLLIPWEDLNKVFKLERRV